VSREVPGRMARVSDGRKESVRNGEVMAVVCNVPHVSEEALSSLVLGMRVRACALSVSGAQRRIA